MTINGYSKHAIPFKTIRYKKGIKEWGVNFSRLDITAAEKSAWAPVPRQFPTASLAYTGELIMGSAATSHRFKLFSHSLCTWRGFQKL